MEEGSEDRDVPIPANQKPSIIAQPGDGAFDLPSATVSPKRAAVLMLSLAVGEVGSDELNASPLEPTAESQGVIPAIANESIRILTWPTRSSVAYSDRGERLGRELDLTRASAMEGNSQRKTLAVCQYHELCALALPGLSDVETPFLPAQRWRP
jgi:hypothetical protein